MNPVFVLAFGGTGSRCLEAITYLAAARVIRDPLHVLLIDPDESNGNVDDAREQLQRYQRIHGKIEGQKEGAGPSGGHPAFFSTPINEDLPPGSFYWQYPGNANRFSEKVQLSALDADTRALVELLYDDHDLNHVDLKKGYWGRSHIGSLDLLQTLGNRITQISKTSEGGQDSLETFFARLRRAAQESEPRLMVVGSIFGGTGASGLPAVPPLLRQFFAGQEGFLDKVRLGCVQMTPYFTFGKGTEHDPDSALHPLATQAALYHYALSDAGYEAIYLAGAPRRAPLSDTNDPGGPDQRNHPHYAELAAALAAAHFFESPPRQGERRVYATGGKDVSWATLPDAPKRGVQQHLTSFTAFCLLHAGVFHERFEGGKHKGDRWLHDLVGRNRERSLRGNEAELQDLKTFAERYVAWISRVGKPGGEGTDVKLFGFDAADVKLDERAAAERLSRLRGGKADTWDKVMRHMNSGLHPEQRAGVGWYMAALTASTDRLDK